MTASFSGFSASPAQGVGHDTEIAYSQLPKPYSSELELTLTQHALDAMRGENRQSFPLAGIEAITLTFTPRNTAFKAFTCLVRARDGRSLTFTNLNWKSLIETERKDAPYTLITRALIERAARANPDLVLKAGVSAIRFWGMLALGAVMMAALIAAMNYVLARSSLTISLLAGGLIAYLMVFLYQFLSRNRPRPFTAGAIPPDLLPKSSSGRVG